MNGLILSGGKSSRMGQEKGLIPYHGIPEILRIQDLLKNFCSNVFISIHGTNHFSQIPTIEDRYTFRTPLNGIASAILGKDESAWLICPCDMPETDNFLIDHLIQNRDSTADFNGFYDSDGINPEPLLGIYENSCRQHLSQFITHGDSPRKFLETIKCNLIVMPDVKYHKNINTREDFEKYSANNRLK